MVPAGLSGYGTRWDRLTSGGVTVPHLLLIDATLGAVAIMLAVWIVVRSARRDRRARGYGEVAGLAEEGTALGEMTVVPGLSEAGMEPDPGARGPDPDVPEPDPGVPEPDPDLQATDPGLRALAGLEQAPPQASQVAGADPAEDDPEPGAPEPARPEQAPAQLNGAAGAGPGAHAPAAEPGGQPGADSTVPKGRVSSYYEGADQEVADYLAELGWSEESGARNWG